MKSILSIFAVKAVIMTAIVGAVAAGVWYVHFAIEELLSTPHTFGDITITPYGHRQNNLLDHFYDSIKVEQGLSTYMIRGPHLDVTILGENRGVALDVNEVSINFVQDTAKSKTVTKDTTKLEAFAIPDNWRTPLPVKISMGKLDFTMGEMGWRAKNILAKSKGQRSLLLNADSIQGTYITEPANLRLDLDFEEKNVIANVNVSTPNNSVTINATAPKNDVTQLKVATNINVKDPLSWVPMKLPKAVPGISNLSLSGNVSTSLTKKTFQYNFTLKTHIGEVWPFLPLDATIKVNGTPKQTNIESVFRNNEGGHINIDGVVNDKLDFDLSGEIAYMSALYGPQMMPMDMEIKSAELRDKKINVSVETRQGSLVDGVIDLRDSLMITFTGDISPYEPWALDWTQGNLTLGARSKAYGAFDGHSLKILAKINSIVNAYHIAADSLQVSLDLNLNGIDFSNGTIYSPKETFDFDGDVKWNDPHPHTSWNVTQRNGGKASAYVNIGDTIALDVEADHVVFATIPFSDIDLDKKINGLVTGKWSQDFDHNIGSAEVSIDGRLDAFRLGVDAAVRQNGDTIFIDKFDATHDRNSATATGAFILPNDSNPDFHTSSFLPVQLLYANISSHEFNLPLLLEPLNDSTLTSGMLNGDLSYKQGNKLIGNLDFYDIKFRSIPPELFNIRKLNIFAENDKVELNSYLDIGGGGWTGNTQIIINNVFNDKRHVSFSHGSDNGGTLWAEGFIDNDFIFNGTIDANGSWFIPGTVSEIKNTDLHIDMTAELKKGLKGITADLRVDSTIYEPPKTKVQLPIYMRGHLENGLLDINEARTQNDSGEVISANLQFSLDSMKLMGVDINSDRFTIESGSHWLLLENVHSHTTDSEDELLITANIPQISYKFKDDVYGQAEAKARGDIGFSIPHGHEGLIKNNTITGNIVIDKAVFYKDFDIDITPSALDKYLTMFNNSVAKLRKTGIQEEKISVSSPINLALHISDSQMDSIAVVTPFATFPLSVDIWVLGNTVRPLLRGDVTNTNTGFIGVREVYEFGLNNFLISWNDVPWQNGVIDVSSSQELPYCSETSEKDKETCPINLDLQGTITNLQAIPSSNCGGESSTASIYYNILLGCIAEDNGEETDWNKLAGKAIGKVISSTANKTLGGDYIGDIDMKVMLFENNTTGDKDSSYFKVPVSLDRWVKNLSLIFGYTQDQSSENRTYDQALQFGVNYTLPVFQEAEYSHKNHLSPSLELNAMLISKQYLTNTGTESGEMSRIEKNIGIDYTYRFWNPCLLGFGRCETMQSKPKEESK